MEEVAETFAKLVEDNIVRYVGSAIHRSRNRGDSRGSFGPWLYNLRSTCFSKKHCPRFHHSFRSQDVALQPTGR